MLAWSVSAGAEAGVARTVLSTLGQLAAVSAASFRPYVSEVGGWAGVSAFGRLLVCSLWWLRWSHRRTAHVFMP